VQEMLAGKLKDM